MRAHHQRSEVILWQPDHSHPTPAGTFLAASMFLGALTGGASSGIGPHPTEITDDVAAYLQSMADHAVGDGG